MEFPVTFGAAGKVSLLSPAYRWMPRLICRKLLRQSARCAAALARDSAGRNNAPRMGMMAMTTSRSISAKARRGFIPDIDTPDGDSSRLRTKFRKRLLRWVKRRRGGGTQAQAALQSASRVALVFANSPGFLFARLSSYS